jgi:hypothetical protein
MTRKLLTILPSVALAITGLGAAATAASAAPRAASPTLSVSVAGTPVGAASSATMTVGQTAHIASGALDASRQVVIYKGQWMSSASGTGWTYLYYKAFSPNADGTFAMDEQQDTAGQFRYQACQYFGSKGWNCSDYAPMTVSS